MDTRTGDRAISDFTNRLESLTRELPKDWTPRQRTMSEKRGEHVFVQFTVTLRVPNEPEKAAGASGAGEAP